MKNKDLAVIGLLMAATWNLSEGPSDAQFRVLERLEVSKPLIKKNSQTFDFVHCQIHQFWFVRW